MTKEEQLLELCKTEKYDVDLSLTLIEGVDINKIIQDEEETFLSVALRYGNYKMVEFLLENGADPNLFVEWWGPLLWELQYVNDYEFSEEKQLSLVKFVLEHGANPNIVWDNESLMEEVCYQVFNEIGNSDWDYLIKFFVYLIAYGGKLTDSTPEIYKPIDKDKLEEYEFFFAENGRRGQIIRDGEVVAYI